MTNGTPNFDFETMTREWRDRMMDDWGQMAKAMVGSDSFAATSAACMDWSLFWQKQLRNQSGQFMEALELPKRSDLARLNQQLMAVEQRVVDVEERLDDLAGKLDRVLAAVEKLAKKPAPAAPAPRRK